MFQPSIGGKSALPLTFALTSTQRITCDNQEYCPIGFADEYRLLLVLQGKLEVKDIHRKQSAVPGACLLINPGSEVLLTSQGAESLFYLLSFTAVNAYANGSALKRILKLLADGMKLPAAVLHTFAANFEDDGFQDELLQIGKQSSFLSLLSMLLEQGVKEENRIREPRNAVCRTIEFVQSNYQLNLTVQQLADMAQLPRWQYLRVFKKMTGSNPSNYITQLRIEQAKALLSHSDEQVWKVAHQVGYNDEHYFNRRFKLETGISPGQYARIYSRKTNMSEQHEAVQYPPVSAERIIYDDAGTVGDLLALDIEPVGANLRFCNSDSFADKIQYTQEIGFPLIPDKIRTLNPDLVLLSRHGSERHPELSAIAPTVGVNEYASMHRRIQRLGEVLGIRERTKQWLDAYDIRCEEMWQRLQSCKSSDESATVLYYHHDGQLYLLHRLRGLAKLLYHPLGFRMDERIQQMRPARGHYYISIAPDRLREFAVGDRLFVFIHSNQHISAAMSELNRWPDWARLPAVQSGKVHVLDSFWNSDDALTSRLALEQFPALWAGSI
ncbi:helix-turn-helix domain-containing protein [Paenibacillus sp. NPDC057967]|uniref:helix-turn-helix domain-containing protein n=1 Tax=Paenibacillus sp. NPDC057967 TaxID=3346293 RepID=UPI0036DC4836